MQDNTGEQHGARIGGIAELQSYPEDEAIRDQCTENAARNGGVNSFVQYRLTVAARTRSITCGTAGSADSALAGTKSVTTFTQSNIVAESGK